MIKTRVGTNPDSSPRFNYELTQEEHDAGFVAFVPGSTNPKHDELPAAAWNHVMADGTAYDITEVYVPVRVEHVGELRVSVLKAHHAVGRFLDVPVPAVADVELPEV